MAAISPHVFSCQSSCSLTVCCISDVASQRTPETFLLSTVLQHGAGIAGLQAAVDAPSKVRGVQLLDISLRMLHTTKQQPWQRPLVTGFQRLLRDTQLGQWFFGAVAKPQVLSQFFVPFHGLDQLSYVQRGILHLPVKPFDIMQSLHIRYNVSFFCETSDCSNANSCH